MLHLCNHLVDREMMNFAIIATGVLAVIYMIAALLFMLFWFLPESWQDRISEIFCHLFAAERGDK